MIKFNELGLDVIELKEAFSNDYPEVVMRSLNMNVKHLVSKGLISQEISEKIIDKQFDHEDFRDFCLLQENLIKSHEQLLKEYEAKRLELVKLLNDTIIEHKIESRSYIDKDAVVLIKTFHFGYDEAKLYFGISQSDCEKLFERHGFISQFATLRMKKILTDFSESFIESDLYKLNITPVFYSKATRSYAIEFVLEIHINTLGSYSNLELIVPLKEIIEEAVSYYDERLPYHSEVVDVENIPTEIPKLIPVSPPLMTVPYEIKDTDIFSENDDDLAVENEENFDLSDDEISSDLDIEVDIDIDDVEIDIDLI